MPEEKEPSGFKVVDRRSFSEDGSPRDAEPAGRRSESQLSPGHPPLAKPQEKSEEDTSERRPRDGKLGSVLDEPELSDQDLEEPLDDEGANFATLVSYLSTTAMFQLGLLPGPGGERIPADFPNARRTIDLLAVLQQKTEGNLTPEEAQMLEEVLYELRLTFVEAEQRRGAPRGR